MLIPVDTRAMAATLGKSGEGLSPKGMVIFTTLKRLSSSGVSTVLLDLNDWMEIEEHIGD